MMLSALNLRWGDGVISTIRDVGIFMNEYKQLRLLGRPTKIRVGNRFLDIHHYDLLVKKFGQEEVDLVIKLCEPMNFGDLSHVLRFITKEASRKKCKKR